MSQSITQREVPCDSIHKAFPAAMAYLWTRTALLKEVCEVLAAVTAWPGVVIETDRNGICLTLGGVALGHLSWAGRVDLPFGPEVGERLVAEEMVNRHPIAERFIFDVRTEEDVDRAVWLLRLAYLSTDPKVSTCEHDVAPRPGMRTRRLF